MTKNITHAVALFEKAVDHGLARAHANLGVHFLEGLGVVKDAKRAVQLFETASGQGDDKGKAYLGICYLQGAGVPANVLQGVRLVTDAAKKGQVDAQWQLGYCYAKGQHLAYDENRAFKWLTKAADQRHEEARLNLAQLATMASSACLTSSDMHVDDAAKFRDPFSEGHENHCSWYQTASECRPFRLLQGLQSGGPLVYTGVALTLTVH